MKRILNLLIFLLILFPPSVTASPILFGQTTVDLSSLIFNTTGDLEISLGSFTLDWTRTSGKGSSAVWLSQEEFGISSSIYIDDLISGAYQLFGNTYNWSAFVETGASITANFTASGTGYLEVFFDYQWIYYEQPWAQTDMILQGPDQNITYVGVENLKSSASGWGGGQHNSLLYPPIQNKNDKTQRVLFENGDSGKISILLWGATGGYYFDKPSVPVPEPASMLIFGTGVIVIGGYLRRRFRKS